MIGFKHTIAHKQPVKDKQNVSEKTQKKKLIIALQELLDLLESEDQMKIQVEKTVEKASNGKTMRSRAELTEPFNTFCYATRTNG